MSNDKEVKPKVSLGDRCYYNYMYMRMYAEDDTGTEVSPSTKKYCEPARGK
jgi:hypothetical protein